MKVMLTSAGRRVSLLRAFARALAQSGNGSVVAADMDPTAPCLIAADESIVLPSVSSPSYLDALLDACAKRAVRIVVPLIDPELPLLSGARDEFRKHGVEVAVSDLTFVNMSSDKLLTSQVLSSMGLPTAPTYLGDQAMDLLEKGLLALPIVVKPRYGSASTGVQVCCTFDEVQFHIQHTTEPIVQKFLRGFETTIDVFADGKGHALGIVPRKRLKVRAGEVERGVTTGDAPYRQMIELLVDKLRPYGVFNVQCFVAEDGPVFTEVNARFGGGYPLSDAAGARFPEMLIELALTGTVRPSSHKYVEGLVMTRFDDAFFVREEDLAGHVREG